MSVHKVRFYAACWVTGLLLENKKEFTPTWIGVNGRENKPTADIMNSTNYMVRLVEMA
ncbi:MAG: hypothetical protein OEY51_14115 [Cyclobacteriaceae bacterium]|nr:hypothetical protein [Cyclobacteriaceae bacterium]